MSFLSHEHSTEDGRPIFLYEFRLNDKVWNYTSADTTQVIGGVPWLAVPIADDGVSQTGEAVTDALSITTSTKIGAAEVYMQYPPSSPMAVAIFSKHYEDTEIRCRYVGEVTSPDVSQPGTIIFTCETLSATMNREGLRLGWQRNCPHALYDPVSCKVEKAAYAQPSAVTLIVGNLLTVPSLAGAPADRYAGGFVEWLDVTRGIERRGIESSLTDGRIIMFGTAEGMSVGMNLVAYPGCDRTTSSCQLFNNLPNFGGVPSLQGKSPYDGESVFN